MSAIIKFKHVEFGQVLEHVTRVKAGGFDYCVLMKVPPVKMRMLPCMCGNDEWNAININTNGVFRVHFHPEQEVVVNPGQNAWNNINGAINGSEE